MRPAACRSSCWRPFAVPWPSLSTPCTTCSMCGGGTRAVRAVRGRGGSTGGAPTAAAAPTSGRHLRAPTCFNRRTITPHSCASTTTPPRRPARRRWGSTTTRVWQRAEGEGQRALATPAVPPRTPAHLPPALPVLAADAGFFTLLIQDPEVHGLQFHKHGELPSSCCCTLCPLGRGGARKAAP